MTTYCPSCGMNQPTEERSSGPVKQWVCVTCGLVLREENAEVLGRIPVQRMSAVELAAIRAAAERASAEKAAAEKAAKAAQARAALTRAALTRRQVGEAPAPIEFDDAPSGEFVIETMSGNPRSAAAPPAPVAAPSFAPPQEIAGLVFPATMPAQAPPAPQAHAPSMVLGSLFERVVVAEDTALVREIIKDALVQNGISQQVRGCVNGEEFLQVIAESIAAGITVDLAVLDVDMPVLNGYYSAIALRAIERGLRVRPTPIVFFTAYPCDDTFKKVLEHCQPARYLNKGADSSPARIAGRLVQVLASLKR